ncbi:hypothetical protein PRUB_a3457 [Pseudoalteromonas rubra]|uniref:Uncharacterized protein n=1 Tax=Pseudoalteromonas rubra TaxID=43658 RepID=A0A8T0C2V0_9GAMM|nr:hypothetical protein [Pseudoalteromonas rubra]KAF7783631.1 hypothetical protein PRUB_a3457 [Pseudoalteromonas rubra]
MDNHDFSDLAQLWQSTPTSSPALERCIQRHKKQHFRLWFSITIETLILLVVSVWFVRAILEPAPLVTQLWLGFGCFWGGSMYILINKSRVTSLGIIKTQQLSVGLKVHQQLLREEVFRWDLSIKATLLFVLVLLVYALILHVGGSVQMVKWGIGLIALLMGVGVFRFKKRQADQVLKALSE